MKDLVAQFNYNYTEWHMGKPIELGEIVPKSMTMDSLVIIASPPPPYCLWCSYRHFYPPHECKKRKRNPKSIHADLKHWPKG